jgi:hypothetical protein
LVDLQRIKQGDICPQHLQVLEPTDATLLNR